MHSSACVPVAALQEIVGRERAGSLSRRAEPSALGQRDGGGQRRLELRGAVQVGQQHQAIGQKQQTQIHRLGVITDHHVQPTVDDLQGIGPVRSSQH